MVLWILRGSFLVLLVGVGLYALDNYAAAQQFGAGLIALFGMLVLGGLVLVADLKIRNKEITTVSALYFGMLLGLLVGTFLTSALDPFLGSLFPGVSRRADILKLFITLVCCYISISVL